ncbi:hypothetical protein FISHEDRAFT_78784 [Fistulina hepatica ATCC 64428]|uniref:F-box domain-containing protein n=1 Tax=Fistulina hepatica ATCC 64428 TaxID=1128425 RepID=A0A0D7A031_9AGAR|nr:hypothetical protein FISHEDRAFT_78784 [Fistulina hepatica ATCC 64428]
MLSVEYPSSPSSQTLIADWYSESTPSSRVQLTQHLRDVRDEIQNYDVTIAQCRAEMNRLCKAMERLKAQRVQAKKVADDVGVYLRSRPIHRLPVEILLIIVLLAYSTKRYEFVEYDQRSVRHCPFGHPSLFAVPYVCRYWRELCLSARIYPGFESAHRYCDPSVVEMYLATLAPRPISISANIFSKQAAEQLLLGHSDRCPWVTARFFIDDSDGSVSLLRNQSLPLLQNLILLSFNSDQRSQLDTRLFALAPQLANLFAFFPFSPRALELPWSQLQTVVAVVDGSTWHDWLYRIPQCDLRTLALIMNPEADAFFPADVVVPIELPFLSTLYLDLPPSVMCAFIDALTAPCLYTLALVLSNHADTAKSLRSLAARTPIRNAVFVLKGVVAEAAIDVTCESVSAVARNVHKLELVNRTERNHPPHVASDSLATLVLRLAAHTNSPFTKLHTLSLFTHGFSEYLRSVVCDQLMSSTEAVRVAFPMLHTLRLSATHDQFYAQGKKARFDDVEIYLSCWTSLPDYIPPAMRHEASYYFVSDASCDMYSEYA